MRATFPSNPTVNDHAPVAEKKAPVPGSFAYFLAALLASGEGGITSQRALGARLASIRKSDPETERRNVRRYLAGKVEPEEETIADYARAFGIPRKALPQARRGGRAAKAAREASSLEDRLSTLVADLRCVEIRLRREAPDLGGQVSDLREELEGLAESARELHEMLDSHRLSPPAPPAASAAERGGRRS